MDSPGVIELSSDDEAVIAAERAAAQAKRASAQAKRRAKKAAAEAAAAEAAAANKIIMCRGPKSKASVIFDKWCVYGNKIALKHTQVLFMRELAKKKPTLPVYVCTMQLANTEVPKAKMYFPRNFTNANIRPYKDFPSKLRVFCGGRDPIIVSLIMSKGKGKGAQITTQWSQVVAASRMHKGDVFMFRFCCSPTDGPKLEVKKVM